jgi:hypothetical protein
MRLIFEIWNRYLQLETGEIIAPVEEETEEEEAEIIRLPFGFQTPPVEVETDDSASETDRRRSTRG